MKFESQLQIVTAAGVPPVTVNQTALVINFNADLLDGQHGSYYAAASSLGNYLPLTGGTLTGPLIGTTGSFTTLRTEELTSPLGSNSPITITPDGTGHVHINSTDIRLGPNNTNATLATRGTGDLILRTNEGSAVEGFIRIYDGANGNIEITPNGTGTVVVGKLSGSTASFSGVVTSTVATGTAPIVVASTTAVTNLNADLLDGQHGSFYQNASNLNAGTVPAAQMPAHTGDVTSAAGSVNLTLATVATAGTYRSVTIDAKGRVTAGTNPTTLAGYAITDAMKIGGAPGVDLNTLTTAGVYRINNTEANRPNDWGQLLVMYGGSDTITQIYGHYVDGTLKTRSGNPSNVGGTGSWSPWRTLLSDHNYSSYALPLTGGTLTGSLTGTSASFSGLVTIDNSTPSDILRLKSGGSTVWKLGVTDASGSYLNITADFGNVTIYKLNGNITTPGAFVSTVATGTAPLSVTSTTLVSNLNSDYLDGQHGSYYENRDATAVGFSGGTLTLTRAAGNLSVSLDGRYLPLAGGTLTGGLSGTTGSFSGALSISGTVQAGFSRLKVFDYNLNNTPTNGIRIATAIPQTSGVGMYTLIFEGYRYGDSAPEMWAVSFYPYNTGSGVVFINYGGSCHGGKYPSSVQLGWVGGFANIFILSDLVYYRRFTIRAVAGGMGESNSQFEGWVVSDSNPTLAAATGVVTVPFNNEFGNVAVKGSLSSIGAITQNGNQVVHAGNVSTYALPSSGGSLSGSLSVSGNITITSGGSQFRASDGTAAAPGYSFNADTDTGIRRTSDNSIAIVTGGVDRLTFGSTGTATFSGQIASSVATGTAPLSITSTTLVSNLNADLLDGQHASYFENLGITAVGFSGGTLTLTRAAGNLTASLDGRYLQLAGGTLTGNVTSTSGMTQWSPTTPGSGVGNIHIGTTSAVASTGGAITFGARDTGSGLNAQAGIYVVSDGSYGTKMFLATTDSYAAGSKVAISIDHSGNVDIPRGALRQGGNQVLHAGNVSTYALPIAGGTITSNLAVSGTLTVTGITYANGGLQTTTGQFTGPLLVNNDNGVRASYDNGGSYAWLYGYGVEFGRATSYVRPNTNRSATLFVGGPTINSLDWLNIDFYASGRFTINNNAILHAANYSSYALPLSGGTLTGNLALNTGVIFNRGSAPSITNIQCSIFNELNGISSAESLNFRAYGGFKWQYWDGSATWMQLTSAGLTINGNTALHNGTTSAPNLSIGGNAATASSATRLTNLTSTTTSSAGTDNSESCISYINGISLFGQSDGALYSHVYSASWKHNIYGDYRTGQLAVRGKNNGTWTAWRQVLDSSNYASYLLASDVGKRNPIPETSSTAQYVYLGRWVTVQGGHKLRMRVTAGEGYNANTGQNQMTELYFKTSNGSSSITGSTGVYYADGIAFRIGPNPNAPSLFRVVQVDSVTYDIYGYFSTFTGGGSFYEVVISTGTWNHSGTLATPSGNFIDITPSAILHAGNYNSYALPLTGGTLSGALTFSAGSGTYISTGGGADAFGYNSTAGYGHYIKGTGNTYIYGGGVFFDGSAHRTLLHSASTSAPSLSIGGNAATATSSPLLSALSNYVWSHSTLPTGYNQGIQASFVSGSQGFQNYGSVVTVNTYSAGGGALQLYVPYSPSYGGTGLQVRFGNYDVSSGNSWTAWKTLLASDNYSSYALPLSGGTLTGALSGTSASFSGALSSGGNSVLTVGNYSSYAVDNTKRVKQFFWDTLSASATQARRFEIARIAIDIVNWNQVGTFEIELSEQYWSNGLKKKYIVSYGYNSPRAVLKLVEMSGSGTNNFQVVLGSEQPVSGNQYYLPVYVDVRYYTYVDVRVTTSRQITSNSTPPVGYTYINSAPTPTNITDFSSGDSTVDISNAASAWQVGGNTIIHSGNYTSYPPARWATGRSISLTGDVTGTSGLFDGTANLSFAATLANSGVTAGTYNNVTVNAKGIVTGGSNVSYLTGNQSISITGDATGSGSTAITLTLANSGVTAGTYNNVTVDAKGRVTSGSNVGYLTGNQSITLSGDLSGSGSTSISATVAANAITTTKINNSAVTYAKIQNVGAASVLGNPSASVSQAPQEITFANLGPYINGVARAWVTFNENPSTGAITINASFGISSVTRLAAGVYQVNFSTAFSDTHYAVSGTIGYESISAYTNGGYLGLTRTANPKTTTSCEVAALYGGTNYNARYVHVVFHR